MNWILLASQSESMASATESFSNISSEFFSWVASNTQFLSDAFVWIIILVVVLIVLTLFSKLMGGIGGHDNNYGGNRGGYRGGGGYY